MRLQPARPFRRPSPLLVLLLLAGLLPALTARPVRGAGPVVVQGSGHAGMPAAACEAWMAALQPGPGGPPAAAIREPADGAVVPADAAAPVIAWESPATAWRVTLRAPGGPDVAALCLEKQWVPDPATWQRLREAARGAALEIAVTPIGGADGRTLLPGAAVRLGIDPLPLAATIAYLQLPVPFRLAKHHPQQAAWRAGTPAAAEAPAVFATGLPVCANCHAYSRDGATMALDMDIDGDKGGFVVTPLTPEMAVTRRDCFSWNRLPAPPPAPFSFGLLATLSPDGRHLVGTVGETSLFVMIDRDDFSQLFFPVTGRLAVFQREAEDFRPLPGADDPGFVHTAPAFAPDGCTLAFSRAPVDPALVRAVQDKTVQNESSTTPIEELNRRYPYRFDICTLPFPSGAGAVPRPLEGASGNGGSNYFPRYSPDGRWIVFTRSPTGLVLQPGSRLWIVPAAGGSARELACNTPRLNSWHSWSPDGRWIVFSGKGARAETEIFLCRLADDGTAAPAVRLHRFTTPGMACAVPEFLPETAPVPRSFRLSFQPRVAVDPQNNVR
jgi:hypothetical protein